MEPAEPPTEASLLSSPIVARVVLACRLCPGLVASTATSCTQKPGAVSGNP
jgi:hypothetical protein